MTDKKICWRTIHTGFLICIGLFGMGSFLGIGSLKFLHVFTAFAVLFLLTVFWSSSPRRRGLFLAGILIVLMGAGIAGGGGYAFRFLQSYVYWLMGSPARNPEWVMGYELVQAGFLALICYGAQMIMERNFRFKIAEMVAMFLALFYVLFARKAISRVSVAFMLCYIVLLYVEWTQAHWKKEKEKCIEAYMLWLMPFVAAYFILMLLPKVPETPYGWKFVKTACSQMREAFLTFSSNYLRGNGDDYDLSLSGFSDSGRLRGRNEETHREVMTVENESGPGFHLYLIGKVYDTFDGRQWEQRDRNAFEGRYMDTAETLAAVRRYDRKYQADYLANRDIRIRYKHFRTEFLFAPLKMRRPGVGREEVSFEELGGTLYFDRKKGYGTEYEVSLFQMNAGQDAFWQFLEEASAQEDSLETFLEVSKGITGENFIEADIQTYRQGISDTYGGSESLSDDVELYLKNITEGAGTDVGKLKAIEAELSSFTYTRTPGELPETVKSAGDFLDYFLLEGREGYCTYFATAFVLLARAEGLPARYVQGFCVPVNGKGETMVYSNMAHAWPEVYLKGVGWIPFEPTPGYGEIRYTWWRTQKAEADLEGTVSNPAVENGEAKLPEQTREAAGQETPDVSEDGRGWEHIFLMFIPALMRICLAAVSIFLINRLFLRFRYKKMDETAKFKTEVSRNLRLLAFMGIERKGEETLEEFGERAEGILEEETDGRGSLQFLKDYEALLYGDKLVNQEILDGTKQQQEKLEQFLKKRKRWMYLYYRIISL